MTHKNAKTRLERESMLWMKIALAGCKENQTLKTALPRALGADFYVNMHGKN